MATRGGGGAGIIADGDSAARNAFRVALLTATPDETPLPVNRTQELDPSDILEVRDMAEAIARAEQLVAAPRTARPSSRRHVHAADMFETLGRLTDDTAGPATPAPMQAREAVPHHDQHAASAVVLSVARPVTPVLPVTEDDAYFHPAGRMRNFADSTLEGYRPEPTMLLRAQARRKSFSWILGAVLLPIMVLLAVIAIMGRADDRAPATSTTTIATATLVRTAAAQPPSPPRATAVSVSPPAPPIVTSQKTAESPRSSVPVFDVNSLPSAGKSRSRR